MKRLVGGKIVVMQGFGNPALTSLIEEWGGVGLIAVNPGVDIHWGTCTTIWGSPDLEDLARKPKIPVVAVNNPDGQKLMALASQGGEATIRTEMLEGWFAQKIPVVTIPGTEEPEKFVLVHGHYDSWDVGVGDNATGDATLMELARVLWQNRDGLRRSVKIAWWPGHSTGRYAGSTWFTDAFAHGPRPQLPGADQLRQPGLPLGHQLSRDHAPSPNAPSSPPARSATSCRTPMSRRMRPPQAGDYSFNNIGLPSFFMLSSTMPEALRREKNYYDVSGCGAQHRLAHRERHPGDRRPRHPADRHARSICCRRCASPMPRFCRSTGSATCDEFLATIAAMRRRRGPRRPVARAPGDRDAAGSTWQTCQREARSRATRCCTNCRAF